MADTPQGNKHFLFIYLQCKTILDYRNEINCKLAELGKHDCGECGKSFYQNNHLIRHEKTFHWRVILGLHQVS